MPEQDEMAKLQERLLKLTEQLEQLYKILEVDPQNEECLSLAKEIVQVIRLTKETIESKTQGHENSATTGIQMDEANVSVPIPDPTPTKSPLFHPGMTCEAYYQKTWYPVQIETVYDDNMAYIQYLGFHTKHKVQLQSLRIITASDDPLSENQIQTQTKCRAKYYIDQKYYGCTILEQTELGVRVTFDAYGNTEEVPLTYLASLPTIPIHSPQKAVQALDVPVIETPSSPLQSKPIKIPEHLQILPTDTEAERERKRKRLKALKNLNRQKRLDNERNSKQQGWKAFQNKAIQKKVKGASNALLKRGTSIFASPETVDGRVGVVNSGLGMTDVQDKRKRMKTASSTHDSRR